MRCRSASKRCPRVDGGGGIEKRMLSMGELEGRERARPVVRKEAEAPHAGKTEKEVIQKLRRALAERRPPSSSFA